MRGEPVKRLNAFTPSLRETWLKPTGERRRDPRTPIGRPVLTGAGYFMSALRAFVWLHIERLGLDF
jgi:hypothetical protein